MNKILAITEDIDYIAHRTSLSYAEYIFLGVDNPQFENLKYRYEDAFFSVKCAFEQELKKLNTVIS